MAKTITYLVNYFTCTYKNVYSAAAVKCLGKVSGTVAEDGQKDCKNYRK